MHKNNQTFFHAKGYDIIEKIGEGSFSDVHKVRNKKSRKLFAAKRLKKEYERYFLGKNGNVCYACDFYSFL